MRKAEKKLSRYENSPDDSLFTDFFQQIKEQWFHIHTRGRREPLCAYVHSLHYKERADAYILVYTYYPPSKNWNAKYLKSLMDLQIWTKVEDREKIESLNRELTKMLLRN